MSIPKRPTGPSETGVDTATEHATDLQRLQEGIKVRGQLFETVKLQLIAKIQDSSVQRAISAIGDVIPSHKLDCIFEKAGIPNTKGTSDSETMLIAATDMAKRKLDLQNRLTTATEEQEVLAITKLLRIARIAEDTLIAIAKALAERPAMRDIIDTKKTVMGFGDDAFKAIRPLLNDKFINLPLYATGAQAVDGEHRSFIQAILQAEEALVSKTDQIERTTHEHMDRLALFRKLASNMRRNAHAFRGNGVNLRINQLNALHALASFLENEGYGDRIGYYKQPTGAGKTFLFGIMIRLMDVKSLILVPRTNLRDQTRDELVESVGIPDRNIQIMEPGDKVLDRPVTINTYQNHIWRMENDPAYQREVDRCELVICDEAHRSLGPATLDSLEAMDGEFDDAMTEEDERNQQKILENIDQYVSKAALKLGFTATPELSQKSVQQSYKIPVAESSYSELVKARIIKKFKVRQVGASIHAGEIDGSKIGLEHELAMLHRENVYFQLLDAFKKAKEEVDEELYALATCATIPECDTFSRVAQEMGLRTVIVTSREYQQDPDTDHKKQAEQTLLHGDKDIIVTVDKLKEGWDFRPLNAVILARATLSPANILQPAGRASRTYKNQKYAYIFEASWHPQKLQDQRRRVIGGKKNGKGNRKLAMLYRRPLSFAEALYLSGENDVNSVCEGWEGEKLRFTKTYNLEKDGTVDIGGRLAIGIHAYASAQDLGVKGKGLEAVIEKAKLPPVPNVIVRGGKIIVHVYWKDEVDHLLPRRLDARGIVSIDGKEAIGVNAYCATCIPPMNESTLARRIEEAKLQPVPDVRVVNGSRDVDVYWKDEIDRLIPMQLDDQGIVSINGRDAVGLYAYCSSQIHDIGEHALKECIRKANLQPVPDVKVSHGCNPIIVYWKDEVDRILPKRLSPEGIVSINGKDAVGLSAYGRDLRMSLQTIERLVGEANLQPVQNVNVLSGKRPIFVYWKDEVDSVLRAHGRL